MAKVENVSLTLLKSRLGVLTLCGYQNDNAKRGMGNQQIQILRKDGGRIEIMPRLSPFKKAMKDYLEHCYQRGLTEETIRSYENTLIRVETELEKVGLTTNPKKIRAKERGYILRRYRGKADTIRKFDIFLKWNGNYIASEMRVRIPQPQPRRSWLTNEDAELLRASDMTPTEKMIIHLALDLGMRRTEMARAKLVHFQGRYITIIGKGTFGGKIRYLKLTNLTKWMLNDYLPERPISDPHLLVHKKGPYTPNGITGILWRLSKRLQIPFSSHTLRRTFARSLREQGADYDDIRDLLGHKSVGETEKYIGSNIDRQDTALVEYHNRRSQTTLHQLRSK